MSLKLRLVSYKLEQWFIFLFFTRPRFFKKNLIYLIHHSVFNISEGLFGLQRFNVFKYFS